MSDSPAEDKLDCYKSLIQSWGKDFSDFFKKEWRNTVFGYGCGFLLIAIAEVIRAYVPTLKLPSSESKEFYDVVLLRFSAHFAYWALALACVVVPFLLALLGRTLRVFIYWLRGESSGCFVSSLIGILSSYLVTRSEVSVEHLLVALAVIICTFILGYALRVINLIRNKRPVTAPVPGSPIESPDQDQLGRGDFVVDLTHEILFSNQPIIALRGDFGDGKSSVLKLLQKNIGTKAFVVPFNAWLPNTPETLIDELLNEIVAEIGRSSFVPGLGKTMRKFASLLAGSVSSLKFISDLFPSNTQGQEVKDLRDTLNRIPKRVVVLLDEIDRMQKEEILALLKILRGVPTLPNITFVCAMHQEQVERTLFGNADRDSHQFMEKFFPIGRDLPRITSEVLKPMLLADLKNCFPAAEWPSDATGPDLINRFEQLHDKSLNQLCTNIRRTDMFVNAVKSAANLLRNEVDPIDLCAFIALGLYHPKACKIVWDNRTFFSRTQPLWLLGAAREEDEIENAKNIKLLIDRDDPGSKQLLKFMFEERMLRILHSGNVGMKGSETYRLEPKEKAISHSSYFPVYFSFQNSSEVFSTSEFAEMSKSLKRATNEVECKEIFARHLQSLEKHTFRESDFFRKLRRELEQGDIPIQKAQYIAIAIAKEANDPSEEPSIFGGKIGIECIFGVARRLAADGQNANELLEECVLKSSTPYFAYEIVDRLEKAEHFQRVDMARFIERFSERMKHFVEGFGHEAEITQRDLIAISKWNQNEVERETIQKFLKHYIGSSRQRLGNLLLLLDFKELKNVTWLIPESILRDLVAGLEKDQALNTRSEEMLDTLDQLLKQAPSLEQENRLQ